MNKAKQWAFWNGWLEIPPTRRKELRKAIMKIFGLTSRGAWYDRINGRYEPKASEKIAVEELFRSYNVPIYKVWGDNRFNNDENAN